MTSPRATSNTPRRKANLFWLAAYLATMTALVLAVLEGRKSTLREMGTPEARTQWNAWRAAEPNQDTGGPVRRQPPSSDEPPALVLMRDYFAMVMSGSLLFGSLLFAALMLAVRGALSPDAAHKDGR